MKKHIIFTLVLLFLAPQEVWGIDVTAQQKYPYVLLTQDDGILSENDLAAYTWDIKPLPFSSKESSGEHNYWQCFPRENVSVTLEDMGNSSEDNNWKDTYADLEIKVFVEPGVFHEYSMRRAWPVSRYQKDFTRWHELMTREKYVCLAGSFDRHETITEEGVKKEIYAWTFDKIKTKKGCSAYFHDCGRTYAQYKHDKSEFEEYEKHTRQETKAFIKELKQEGYLSS